MRQGRRKELLDGTRRHGSFRFKTDRFLFSRVGRKWDDVHSELSKEFDRRTYAGYRFWRSFTRWGLDVATNCWIGAETGTVYDQDTPVEGFYVHPFTGILSYKQPEPRRRYYKDSETRIVINGRYAYEKIEGIWYYTEYIPNIYYDRYSLFESKPYTVISQRQLNHKQLRDHNLENNTPEEVDTIKKLRLAKEKAERDACKAKALAWAQGA